MRHCFTRSISRRVLIACLCMLALLTSLAVVFGRPYQFANASAAVPVGVDALANNTLHWTQASYENAPKSIDPANGQVVTTEVWIVVGASGVPLLMHLRSMLPNGALHQEIVQTAYQQTLVFGRDYLQAGLFPEISTASCAVLPVSKATNSSDMIRLLPESVRGSTLATGGYVGTSSTPSLSVPATTREEGMIPDTAGNTPRTITHWSLRRALSDALTEDRFIESDPNGRVITESVQYLDNRGSVTYSHWSAMGAVDMYSTARVPTNLLQVPAAELTECSAATPENLASHITAVRGNVSGSQSRALVDMPTNSLTVSLTHLQKPTSGRFSVAPLSSKIATTTWDCRDSWDILPYYMGTADGTACRTFDGLGDFWWETKADTTAPSTAQWVQAEGAAFDRCYSNQSWTWRMDLALTTHYNATYVQTPINAGNYYDCSQSANHQYYVWAYHALKFSYYSSSFYWDQDAYW